MAKRKRTHAETPKDVVPQRLVLIVGVLLLVIECALLPGLTSPFRLPKMALLTGVVAALAGVALANQVYRTGRVWPRSKIALCLLTYPALLAISTFWSALPRWALTAALVSLGIVLTTLWLSTFSFRQRHTLVRFAASGVTVSSFVAALQFFDSSPFAVAAKGRSSLTGLSGNPSDLAMAAVLLLPLLLFGGGDAVRNRKPDWVFAGILSVAVLSTQSMTGVAALLAFWLVVLIGYRHSRQAWIMAAGSFLVLLVIAGSTGVVQRTQDIVGRVSQGNVYDALSARTDGWSAGLEMLRNSPVLGVGAGNYTHAYYPARLASLERSNSKSDRTELSTHFEWAHNDPLQLCSELGLAGAAWLIWLCVCVVATGRRDIRLLTASGAAFVPFLLLHYPTHIATGLIPCILLLAELLAVSPSNWYTARKPIRLATAILILGVVGAGSMWAFSRVSHGGWLFNTNAVLGLVESVDRDKRPILASRIEADAVRYANKHKVFAPEVWRLVGKSRLLAAKHLGAEDAFRTAFTLWPHEEAELGLGITLAARGKRTEAIPHLARVVRVNKRLESMIADQNLRRAVNDYLEVPTR